MSRFGDRPCGGLRGPDAGTSIALCGWVDSRRDHGGVYFFDLRDRSGIIQIVVNPEQADAFTIAGGLGAEFVVKVTGEIRARPAGTENSKIPTGEVEVVASAIEVLNTSKTLPFEIDDDATVSEEVRLKYRFLDLRRPRMLKNLTVRHKASAAARSVLDSEGFLEIETPMLTKATPEGARDFLVPCRVSPGTFYALPQSPQIFKQILMASGVERYYQFARAFRDEDLRSDRQFEHTQIDLEMSFVEEKDVHALTEKIIAAVFKAVNGTDIKAPFQSLDYDEALLRYGSDKPDLRFGFEIQDCTTLFKDSDFKVFSGPARDGGVVRALKATWPFSRTEVDKLTDIVKAAGAKGLAWIKWDEKGPTSPILKFLSKAELAGLEKMFSIGKGDYLFFGAGKADAAAGTLGLLRRELIKRTKAKPTTPWSLLWVRHFPLLEWVPEDKRWTFSHNPFTAPLESEVPKLDSDPGSVLSYQYDLVLNGVELASGSIRNHKAAMQRKILGLMGFSEEKQDELFGLLLNALDFGAPPHGGIAIGFDRLVATLQGEESIREVIAFPKTTKGACLLSEAPSTVDPKQLRELHISTITPAAKTDKPNA